MGLQPLTYASSHALRDGQGLRLTQFRNGHFGATLPRIAPCAFLHRRKTARVIASQPMKDRSSFAFFLSRTTKMVLIPFVVLDALIFAITTMQHGIPAAWTEI